MTNRDARPTAAPPTPRYVGLLFAAAVVVVGLRPLIQETSDTQQVPFSGIAADVPDISPLPSLWISLVIVMLFGLTHWARLRGHLPPQRWRGIGAATILLIAAALGSCLVAGNHRLALNVTLNWMTLPLLTITLVQLTRHAWQRQLLLAVIGASAAAFAVECFDQVWVSIPATIAEYERNPQHGREGAGEALPDYYVELFEKRLREGAAHGYVAHSNIAGSYLLLVIFAMLGVARGSIRQPALAFVQLLPAAALIAALWLTRSRGALLAAGAAGALTLLLWSARRKTSENPRRAFVIGWGVVLAGLAPVVAVGLTTGKLPGGSLTYRWWYLESSARMVADHPWTGVGSGQYGRHYPRYKEIKSPEEIANPHNFLAQAATEWGLPGLLGMVLLLWGASRWVCGVAPAILRTTAPSRDGPGIVHPLRWLFGLGVVIWGLRIWISGYTDPQIIVGRNAFACCGWLFAFMICCTTPRRALDHSLRSPTPAALLGAGLFAFLLHNLISFSLFVPGPANTFFAVLAVVLSARPSASTPAPVQCAAAKPAVVVVITSLAFTLVVFAIIRPASRCWAQLQAGRAWSAIDPSRAEGAYRGAAQADRLDPTPVREWLQFQLAQPPTGDLLHRLEKLAPGETPNPLTARDPENVSAWRLCARAALADYEAEPSDDGPLRQATAYYERVLELYPTNPEDRIRMSYLQQRLYQHDGDPQALERAIRELREALKLNDQRDPLEIRRFPEDMMQQLHRRLRELESQRRDAPPPGAP